MDHERDVADREPPDTPGLFPSSTRARERIATFPQSERTRAFRRRFFPDATAAEWNDWRWQLRHRIRDLRGLARVIRLSAEEESAVARHVGPLPVGITPYYASLLSETDPDQPLRRTHIPVDGEYLRLPGEADDPLGEDARRGGARCRASLPRPRAVPRHRLLQHLLPLLHAQPDGGRRRGIHVQHRANGSAASTTSRRIPKSATCCSRAATRSPSRRTSSNGCSRGCAPSRMSNSCASARRCRWCCRSASRATSRRMLRRYHPLWMSLHFTHPDELTPEVAESTARLADAGIPLGSQSVLLRGINDDVGDHARADARAAEAARAALLSLPVRPDHAARRISARRWRRGSRSSADCAATPRAMPCPSFVIDAPGGGGKIQLVPDAVVGREGDDLLLQEP